MIFVTVGTHEQPFDRLIEYIDHLKGQGLIEDEIVVQTGFGVYEPQYCKWSRFLSYDDMTKYTSDADIVITHGGPASFILPIQMGKIPVVVPRQKVFGEHINDHQVEFTRVVAERMKNIILILDINDLRNTILGYDQIVSEMSTGVKSNNAQFNRKLSTLVSELMSDL